MTLLSYSYGLWARQGSVSIDTEEATMTTQNESAQTELNSAASKTLFGTSVDKPFDQSLREQDAKYGRLRVLRIFYDGPPDPWATMPATHAGRPLAVSFKENPTTILSGHRDAFYRSWFADAPTDRDIWWVYWHEPEDEIHNGHFTAAHYRDAFTHLDTLANPTQTHNPRLHTTQVLMDYTLDAASGRNWRDYYPGPQVIDVQAWDMYNWINDGTYQTIDDHQKHRPSLAVTTAEGNQFAIAEVGARQVEGRPQWLRELAHWARDHGAVFVTYFDRGGVALTDPASQQAWREAVGGT
jgi:hypothetical protein